MREGTNQSNKLKLQFSFSYLLMALGFVLTGYFLNLIIFTSLILVHEFGHYLTSKILNFNVEKIIIYPYGGMTKLNDLINRDINEEILIASAGVIVQFFFYLVICFFHSKYMIRDYTMNLFKMYNNQMIFFNLLPIYPLDGGKIVNLLFSKWLNYYFANILTIITSMLSILAILFLDLYCYNFSNIMVMTVLLSYLYKFFKVRKYLYNKLLLERYLYKIKYDKLKIISKNHKFYKNNSHLIYDGHEYLKEDAYLQKLFFKS